MSGRASNISLEKWKASFEALYKAPEAPSTSPVLASPVNSFQPAGSPTMHASPSDALEPACGFLNDDITHEEVKAALKRLKRNKAAGLDGIKTEFIMDASEALLDPLVTTFNQVLNEGVPPS